MDQSDMAEQQKPSTSKAASKAKTKETLKRLKKKKNRGRRVSESSHQELMRKVNQRWGGNKQKNELKEALFDTETKRVLHPASYQRMMDRAVEAHMNRMLQPAPPADLLPSNWVCALCFQPSVGEKQGELFGPYFIRLSPKCQPPELLVPRKLLAEEIMEKSRTEEFSQEETDAQLYQNADLQKESIQSIYLCSTAHWIFGFTANARFGRPNCFWWAVDCQAFNCKSSATGIKNAFTAMESVPLFPLATAHNQM